jgi:hypothetical protein
MSNDATYPYALTITPCERPAGHFQWAITRHGKLIQRSDRPHRTEEMARKSGEAEIERQFVAARSQR